MDPKQHTFLNLSNLLPTSATKGWFVESVFVILLLASFFLQDSTVACRKAIGRGVNFSKIIEYLAKLKHLVSVSDSLVISRITNVLNPEGEVFQDFLAPRFQKA